MSQTFHGDVRPLSHDARYMGTVFGGVDTIDEAIAQAAAAPELGLAPQAGADRYGRGRAALLQHLNLLREEPSKYSVEGMVARGWVQAEHDPEPVYGAPEVQVEPLHKLLTVGEMARFVKLTDTQTMIYRSVRRALPPSQALRVAESYPYPATRD
jgi:hypothetical protein